VIAWSTGLASFGFLSVDQPLGFSFLAFRSTIRLRTELRDRATLYGSVTRLVSTLPVSGTKTLTA
jgi:hypothetical protein